MSAAEVAAEMARRAKNISDFIAKKHIRSANNLRRLCIANDLATRLTLDSFSHVRTMKFNHTDGEANRTSKKAVMDTSVESIVEAWNSHRAAENFGASTYRTCLDTVQRPIRAAIDSYFADEEQEEKDILVKFTNVLAFLYASAQCEFSGFKILKSSYLQSTDTFTSMEVISNQNYEEGDLIAGLEMYSAVIGDSTWDQRISMVEDAAKHYVMELPKGKSIAIGPLMFVNHCCENNIIFESGTYYTQARVIKSIKRGEEIVSHYPIFGKCLCKVCRNT